MIFIKKIILFVSLLSVFVCSVIFPLNAFAANRVSVVGIRWNDIANEYNIDLSSRYVIWIYNNQYYIATQSRNDFGASLNSTTLADSNKLTLQLSNGSSISTWKVYKCSSYYSPYGSYSSVPNNASNYRYDIDGLVFNNFNVTYVNDNNVIVAESVPIGTSVSADGDIVSSHLGSINGVLNEVINLLPVLIPVVITFIAIRKGIQFTLTTLRGA